MGISLGTVVCDVGWGYCLGAEVWRDSHIYTAYSLAFFVTVPWPAPHTQQELKGCLMEWLYRQASGLLWDVE